MFNCRQGLVVSVFSCGMGYYIGTFHPEEGPNCRISGYYKHREDAERQLADRSFAFRHCGENEFCNEGLGCEIGEEV